MAKVKKDAIKLDETLVKLRFWLKGYREPIIIYTTATQSCDFVDFAYQNRAVIRTKNDKEKFEKKFYIFDDLKRKETVLISLDDIKAMSIPFFIDEGEEYNFKILESR